MEKDNFIQKNWRSAMAVQYLIVCAFDFMIAPIFTSWFSYFTSTPIVTWVPLTLQGGGLYHLSMMTIVGVTSWAKTKEKLASANS